ncbi:MAG: MFS transporter [Myxococcota bacterium]
MAGPLDPAHRRRILIATSLGSSMAFIDTTIVNVALPALQDALNASAAEAQWVVESYVMVLGALILVGGALGDRFGQMRVFRWGVIGFALASIACGFAPDANGLIVARVAQGIGGALLIPCSLALLTAAYPPGERGSAIGAWSAFTALATMIGPAAGGWMVDDISWRAVFLVNLPLAAGVLLAMFNVPTCTEPDHTRKLDGWGAILATLGLAGTAFALTEAAQKGITHPSILVAFVLGVVFLVGFIIHESRTKSPMMPLWLFASREFSGANLVTVGLYAALSGILFYLPFVLIQVEGTDAFDAGAALLPIALLISSMSRWAGSLADRFGPGILLTVGATITGIGYLGLASSFGTGDIWLRYIPAAVALGIGMALCVAPLTNTIMTSAPDGHAGVASGINNAVSRIAQGVAVAGFGLLVQMTFIESMQERLRELSPEEQVVVIEQQDKMTAADLPPEWSDQRKEHVRSVLKASFVDATRSAGWLAALLSFASAGIAMTMLRRGSRRHPLQPSQPEPSNYQAYLRD